MTASVLYREFLVDDSSFIRMLKVITNVWKNAVIPLVKDGKRVRVIFTSEEEKRNKAQNARYFGYVLKAIADQAWSNGRQFDAKVWHEYLAEKFGVLEEITLPDGRVVTRRKSTTEFSVAEFAQYMTEVEAYGAQELGVMFPV